MAFRTQIATSDQNPTFFLPVTFHSFRISAALPGSQRFTAVTAVCDEACSLLNCITHSPAHLCPRAFFQGDAKIRNKAA